MTIGFKYYSTNPVDFTYQKVEYPRGEFEVQIPSNWKWKVEAFDEIEKVEIGIDAMSMKDS